MNTRALALLFLAPGSLSICTAQTELPLNVLHTFTGTPDGYYPEDGVIMDRSGNLFGSTSLGGTYGSGFVYELSPPAAGGTTWTETALYSSPASGEFGSYLESTLWFNNAGDLFGTATLGGKGDDGTVFELTRPAGGTTAWTGNVVRSFGDHGITGASGPLGSLLADRLGNRYGVTEALGTFGCGTVYKLSAPTAGSPSGSYEVIYNFTCMNDGGYPWDGLVSDASGNLYGTTNKYGASGYGVVYELAPPVGGGSWTETPIYSFTGGADGGAPGAKVVFGPNGSLFGTTYGSSQPISSVVFELTPPAVGGGPWTESVLHTFTGGTDGTAPHSPLISDGGQGFYGTALLGGRHYYGTVFHLQPPAQAGGAWALVPLHQFTGGNDGALPIGDLLLMRGALYGVTQGDGAFLPGSVYQLIP